MQLVRVALDVPLPTLFDYRLEHATRELIGARVLVPFGRGQRAGLILEVGGAPQVPPERIKRVTQVFTGEPRLAPDLLDLMRFASRYYHYPIGQVVMGTLPQALRRARASPDPEARVALTPAALAADWSALPPRAVARRRVLEHLRAQGPCAPVLLRSLASTASRALKDLMAQGWVAPRVELPRDTTQGAVHSARSDLELTVDQDKALRAIEATLGRFAAWVLLGVTGSGKTEVYLRLIERVLARGGQALLLVPEINLTPQLEARLGARFPGAVLAGLHSGVPEAERLRRWRAAESAHASILVGTRLAVFTPLPQLGLIVVDEEHDASFKQQEGLRYSARDLAVLRAKHRQVPVVLGSATPSLETYASALAGRYRLAQLPSRAHSQLPSIRCVDTRAQRLREGLSSELIDALTRRLASREQSLVFVNRRGYAPALVCLACGWSAPCPRCSARLVLHLSETCLRCHYCGHEERVIGACPSCGNLDLTAAGHGTQRIEHALGQLFPAARVLRIDRDSARKRLAFERMQQRIQDHDVDILVGTQMLAKGHDFPRLTLVGVVNADSALYSTDFRAAERLFAQLTQVAGRAGRRDASGEVLIQTEFPDHPLYQAVQRQDYAAFAQLALAERREATVPPYAHQVLLRAEAPAREAVDHFLGRAARAGRRLSFRVEIYEPVPASVARVAGRERGHLLVQSGSRNELQRFVDAWAPCLSTREARRVRWALDVDPLDF
ncbi:MAG TPA: primosomal protein N' [Burkholderiales bacterium]|nr:primosomal protein N' [Burkholderiales bacterium]